MAMNPLGRLISARIKVFFREPAALFWVFVFPLGLSLVLGTAFRDRPPDPARVGLPDDRPGHAELERILNDPEHFTVHTGTRADLDARLDRGALDIIAVLDAGMLDVRFDPARQEARLARLMVAERVDIALGRKPVAELRETTAMPRGARYIDYLMPGLIAMGLLGSALWGVGYGMVQERSRKLMRRFATTPLSRTSFLLSYLVSRVLFLTIEIAFLVAFGAWAFGVEIQGSILLFALVALVGVLCFCGLAVLCASRTASVEVVSGYINALTLPMWLMSGTFFSWERFPEFLHPVIQALPLTALNDALRAITNHAAGPAEVLPQVAVLAAWGLIAFTAGVRLFRWK
jgi:ABC-2 type transport system permease protein